MKNFQKMFFSFKPFFFILTQSDSQANVLCSIIQLEYLFSAVFKCLKVLWFCVRGYRDSRVNVVLFVYKNRVILSEEEKNEKLLKKNF